MTKKFGTRKNPKTGMRETYELPDPIDLEKSRKELRDVIHGNFQWHNDPYAAPKEEKPEFPEIEYESDQDQDWLHIYNIGNC